MQEDPSQEDPMQRTTEGPGLFQRALSFPATCVHGFTGRNGGVSQGVYASLNMAWKWGDNREAVDENWRRVAASAGFPASQLRIARQVHGTTATVVAALADPEVSVDADAIVALPGDPWIIGVITADCVPVLLCDPGSGVVAAVHAGWRGMVAGVIGVALEQMQRAGANLETTQAAIGPCIERAAFEVGEEVASRFDAALVDRSKPKPHVDLVAAARAQLRAGGLRAQSIERVGACTHDHPSRWFSYRRDGAPTGQQLAFIQPIRGRD